MASLAASAAAAASAEVTHLSQRDAAEIDEQLMGPLGFSVDQLMVWGIPPKLPCCCSFRYRGGRRIGADRLIGCVFQELAGLSVAEAVAEVRRRPLRAAPQLNLPCFSPF
jgi:hypothetical protein